MKNMSMATFVSYIRATGIYDDSRATKEIMTLASNGYKVYVIGWDRDGLALKRCKELFRGKNVEFTFFDQNVGSKIGFKGIFKMIGFIRFVMKSLREVKSRIDIVHACNLDAGWGAYLMCKKFGTPMVYDIYDYYIDSHKIPRALIPLIEWMEITVINHSKCTIICTEERMEQLQKADPKKVVVIYNSPNIQKMVHVDPKWDYAYCGSLGRLRLIQEILDEYPKHQDMKFVFAGSGMHAQQAKLLSEKYENFTFLGSLSYKEVLSVEKQTKIISAIYEPSIRNHRLCAPNKFYESLALGKPVIVCKHTGIDVIVEEHDLGAVIDYSAAEFYDALEDLTSDENRCVQIGERARKIYEEKYNWTLMEQHLLQLYREII